MTGRDHVITFSATGLPMELSIDTAAIKFNPSLALQRRDLVRSDC